MNERSWRHHYIPQFYLKGFTTKNGTFKIFDVEKGRFIKDGKDFSTESFFYEKDGNTLISEDSEDDFLEKGYAKRDSRIAEIFNRINSSTPTEKFNLSDDDIAQLQHFVGVMYWRIPSNFEEVKHIIGRKKLKDLGLVLKDRTSNEIMEDSDFEKKLKSDPNFFKAMRSHFPDISYPEIFNCNTPVHILPFPHGLPSVCSDNPIVCKAPDLFRVYSDDLIFPLTSNKILVRGKKLGSFMTSVKIIIDLLIFKQAKRYVSCTDEGYLTNLHELYDKYFKNLNEVRKYLFKTILDSSEAGEIKTP